MLKKFRNVPLGQRFECGGVAWIKTTDQQALCATLPQDFAEDTEVSVCSRSAICTALDLLEEDAPVQAIKLLRKIFTIDGMHCISLKDTKALVDAIKLRYL